MIKVVSFFLIFMLALAMFGRLRWPRSLRPGGLKPRVRRKPKKPLDARKCPDCGSYIIGPGPCSCKDRS